MDSSMVGLAVRKIRWWIAYALLLGVLLGVGTFLVGILIRTGRREQPACEYVRTEDARSFWCCDKACADTARLAKAGFLCHAEGSLPPGDAMVCCEGRSRTSCAPMAVLP